MQHSGNSNPARQTLDAVVIGEALTDVVTTTEGTTEGTTEHPGGSPANVAYGLARLAVSTGVLTALGDDRRGAAIEKHLAGAGVILLPGSRSLKKTSTATATITADGSASYNFDLTWDLKPDEPAFTPPRVLHTGSIASFLLPGADKVRTILDKLRHKCTITYDPNIRPTLLGSHAEAKSIFEDLVHLTDVVKLSDEDAQWLYPRYTAEETAVHLLNLGTGLAVITKGASGSLLATASAHLSIPALQSDVVDTIGAGDSYMSALILGLLTRGTDGLAPSVLEQLGRTASMAAAITVRRRGANPPTLDELETSLAPQGGPAY